MRSCPGPSRPRRRLGNYAPDWAIAFKKGAVKYIYFVAETKGTPDWIPHIFSRVADS
jgi:hypothetical protein